MTERLSLIPKPILTLRREEILDELVIDEHRAPHIRIKQYDTLRFLTLRRLGDVRLDARYLLNLALRLPKMLYTAAARISRLSSKVFLHGRGWGERPLIELARTGRQKYAISDVRRIECFLNFLHAMYW